MNPKRAQIIQGLAPIHRLIVCVFKRLGKELGTVELVKIVYLIDVEFFRLFGKTLTGLSYIRHKLGPYTRSISEAVIDLEEYGEGIIETRIVPSKGHSSIPKRSHKLVKEIEFEPDLYPVAQEVATQVLKEIESLSVKQLEAKSYKTEPMKAVLKKERKAKIKLYGAPLDFSFIKRDEFIKRWLDNRKGQKKDLEYDLYLEREKHELAELIADYES